MSSLWFAVLVLCAASLSTMVPAASSMPRLSSRRLDPVQALVKQITERAVCKNYMEECIPWETKCCGAMTCINLAKGYCLHPLEPCRCQRAGPVMF